MQKAHSDLVASAAAIDATEHCYLQARAAPPLVRVAACKNEAEFIELQVQDMLRPLRDLMLLIKPGLSVPCLSPACVCVSGRIFGSFTNCLN